MRNTIQVQDAVLQDNQLLLQVSPELHIGEMQANGQMLVDSDGLSFIYISEKNNEYIYIVIEEGLWTKVKKAIHLTVPVYLSNKNEQLLLTNFQEEITYLIDNIKGNSNYGDEMVKKVETIF